MAKKRGSVGSRRYQAFVREAKRDGQTHKEALQAYRYFKAALGETPKRGQYREYHHLVEESKQLPIPRKPRRYVVPEERGGERVGIRHAGPAELEWWESGEMFDAFDEHDEDVYAA